MRNLFLACTVFLICFSQVMVFRDRGIRGGEVPVLYWATYADPIRNIEIKLFRDWLKKNRYPDIDLRVDAANRGVQKAIIQGVSGVASDLIDSGAPDVRYLFGIGILQDLNDMPAELTSGAARFTPGIRDDLFIGDRRFAYSFNVGVQAVFVNVGAFRAVGMSCPPLRNDLDQFEKIGVEYVKRANAGSGPRKYFFIDGVNPEILRRSAGVSYFNETLTRSGLDTRKHVEILKRMKKWSESDHLFPSLSEKASFSSEQGLGGVQSQFFFKGYFAMILSGRWVLVNLRRMSPQLELSTIEPPYAEFPNTYASSGRVVSVYKGSPHVDLAKYFLAFLASEDFSRHIVAGADANPPDPAFLDRKEFLRPAEHTNEWSLHENLAQISKDIALGKEYSPFASATEYLRDEKKILEGFASDYYSPEECVRELGKVVDHSIREYVKRHPAEEKKYQEALLRQDRIDALKKAGRKIPASLIDNSFLKAWYRHQGQLEE